MKKRQYWRLLPLVIAISSGGAFAQSSVTLYGIADAGLTYVSNSKGSTLYSLTSGNYGAGRWGFRGVEDLGGGLKTLFTLESGYSLVNGTMGQNGTLFGRQAFVGIDSNYGTVLFGRQYSSASIAVGPIESGQDWAAPGAQYGAHPGDVDNLDNNSRINNAIKFLSRNYNGFSFGGVYSPGGVAGDFSRNQIWDLSASYTNASLRVAVGYLYVNDPNYSLWGNKANDSKTGNNISSPIFSGYASAASQRILSAGASYTIGSATLGAVYSNTQFRDLGSVSVAGLNTAASGYHGNAIFNIGEVNFKYQVTPALLLGVSYAYTHNSGASGLGSARYQQENVGAVYSLSKRTSLYAILVHQNASGTDSTGGRAVAAIQGTTQSSTGSQTLVTMGLTQRF
ncbi:porin [Paraburkholderia sp. Ac-20336]|uniref:porin n=1 Tax=Burkholderiaceae TaxID=119060 RepID=UPI00142009BE|nr:MULTISPECIES: porin [Burkholderiaceae]MBN3802833.1 porin [Paraburkholderia sp. Ac-20336]MBN3847541.1 porin [Paraburkholderia sp. Ac-20342]NIF52285.1 porin [Burkholderia sp. Ax-1724]NIF79597.1 porin [Paraburkholderia sp. Cy-641]